MKKGFLFLATCLAFVFVVLPHTSEAYLTTAQSAEMLKDGKGILFSVTYEFGSDKYEFEMPIVPVRHEVRGGQSDKMTYALRNGEDLEPLYGETVGVVVSDAKILEGKYIVPRGETKKFTLITLLRLPQTLVYEPFDLSLEVMNLPFMMKYDGGEQQGKLNPSELQYYRTPSIKN